MVLSESVNKRERLCAFARLSTATFKMILRRDALPKHAGKKVEKNSPYLNSKLRFEYSARYGDRIFAWLFSSCAVATFQKDFLPDYLISHSSKRGAGPCTDWLACGASATQPLVGQGNWRLSQVRR
jgi:hypothetical protein